MGDEKRLPDRINSIYEAAFPNLGRSRYQVTSFATTTYNCVAYAAGDNSRKWDPSYSDYYWPAGAVRDTSIDGLVSAFAAVGFKVCAGMEYESGYDKVALYVDKYGRYTHAAKQLEDGAWSSKLGDVEDIRHSSPYALQSNVYGEVMYFMKRQRQPE